ncbi:MAG: WhiB family transcriptional regulator [Actinomycetota bacterium]|jgi:WhiB family redox-sensing transcriptional regulator
MYAISFNELAHNGDAENELTVDVANNGAARLDWSKARCRDGNGTLTHLFFSDQVLEIARAKAMCGKCPLSAACLESALDRAEPWGVWGGELIDMGRIVAHKRPRGRPPKHPRPLVVINEDAVSVPVRVA